jgi:spore maturation protein CgeB
VAALGTHRASHGGYRLFFHDTHHRLVSAPEEMARYDLTGYDGVLAFGEVLRERYAALGWGRQAFTWHEAADITRFHPRPEVPRTRDLVWIGNWGDGERTAELRQYLLNPVRALGLSALVHGVRYPPPARRALRRAGITYGGWLPNFEAPQRFAESRCTVHVPRRFYRDVLPGIPTIRMFEALACGIPLVSAPWDDCEGLFTPGADYLVARSGADMVQQLTMLLHEPQTSAELAQHGICTIRRRHSCARRAHELLQIIATH